MGSYRDVNADKLVDDIKERFELKIPSDLGSVKGAKAYNLDGSISFMLKCEVPEDNLQLFLDSFTEVDLTDDGFWDIHGYISWKHAEIDSWIKSTSIPEWFIKNIEKGKVGYATITKTEDSDYNFDLFVDESVDNKCIIYMEGIFRGHY